MTDILAALKATKSAKIKDKQGNRVVMTDGLLNMSDGVFYSTLYRLGREDHSDCPVEERDELINYLESVHDKQ